jgi:hypothetical protein
MNILNFDTLKYAKRLNAAGMDPLLAEEQAAAMAEVLEINLQNLATKSDLQLLEQRMVIKLGALMVISIGALTGLMKLL